MLSCKYHVLKFRKSTHIHAYARAKPYTDAHIDRKRIQTQANTRTSGHTKKKTDTYEVTHRDQKYRHPQISTYTSLKKKIKRNCLFVTAKQRLHLQFFFQIETPTKPHTTLTPRRCSAKHKDNEVSLFTPTKVTNTYTFFRSPPKHNKFVCEMILFRLCQNVWWEGRR